MNRKKRKEGGGEDGEIDEDEKKEGEDVKEGSFYLTVFAISRGFNTEYLRTI